MTGFMKREIDEVKKAVAWIIRLHRGQNELPSPYKDDKEEEDSAPEAKGVCFRFYMEDPFSNKATASSKLLFFCSALSPSRGGFLNSSIFFKNNTVFRTFCALICLHKITVGAFHKDSLLESTCS
jgi:hypothetical protein